MDINTSNTTEDILPHSQKHFFTPKAPVSSQKKLPFILTDLVIILCISFFYAYFAFHNLGNAFAPETEEPFPYNSSLEITSSTQEPISYLSLYLLDETYLAFAVEVKESTDAEWTYSQEIVMEDSFSWMNIHLTAPAEYVRLTNITLNNIASDDVSNLLKSDNLTTGPSIGEIVLYGADENILSPYNPSTHPNLYDEQTLIPTDMNHLCRTYFDEIYYTNTAYDMIHGLPTFERTHPPFGKILIAIGALLFGFNPFGFRFIGVLFGILMLPFLYLLGRNITNDRGIGAFISFIFAFDFMHYTQTRIATLDVFVTFFIIIMYYFMEQYIRLNFYDTPLAKTWFPLGTCGIAFGFGIASKWTGFYAGAGLAILFFYQMFKRYREYRFALQSPSESTNGINHSTIIQTFWSNFWKTIAFCLLFFITIPFIIYLFSYLPYVEETNSGLFKRMFDSQEVMFTFHSTLDSTHPYSSRWYEWPIMVRPILYCAQIIGGYAYTGISAFGNPFVWWAGIPAFLFMIYLALKKKDKYAGFLCISYLAQYLPWVFIKRYTFIYHYFPSVPFVALMIGYSFLKLKNITLEKKIIDKKSFYCLLIIYSAATYGLFQLFLPVLTGEPISYSYAEDYLRWFETWDLILG